MFHRRQTEVPQIPKPPEKEAAVTEILVHPHQVDQRPKLTKPWKNQPKPIFNELYGSLRVKDGWANTVDNYAKGSITTSAGALATADVILGNTSQDVRLSRWPGAVSLYLAIRSFAMAPSTATFATLGSLDVYYQDVIGGQLIPLGTIQNSDELSVGTILIPTPITDPGGLSKIGQLQLNLSAGATTGTYVWQAAFSYAYLLPTTKGYDIQQVEELYDGHYGMHS